MEPHLVASDKSGSHEPPLPLPGIPSIPFSRETTPERSFMAEPSNQTVSVRVSQRNNQRNRQITGGQGFDNIILVQEYSFDHFVFEVVLAERRVRALMDSIQPVSTSELRSTIATPRTASRSENPAGVIGSPVKGKGGASSSRHQTPNKTWKWQ
ncbi:unnamed protein product [Strongylus vulgaris]|uniref:Uncharacterized protein n=1 Tax=Strongylus vulgaris TaxID=40348 RepID=A0A3P7JJ62_STRVU|nr:unnamed protein product [Strongylus vulgaris]